MISFFICTFICTFIVTHSQPELFLAPDLHWKNDFDTTLTFYIQFTNYKPTYYL